MPSGKNKDNETATTPSNFIRDIINEQIKTGKLKGKVHTRFPPEPNGFLHIGHAKSICLNFGLAQDYGGLCNLRFDDTNPAKEENKYVQSIIEDVRWLGFDWGDRMYFASDYFEKLFEYAVALINAGKAYVDDLSADEIREHRGTLKEPGRNSPHRDRTVEENLDLFKRMRAGEFENGSHVLRAKIDMSAGNLNLRDPVLYRILKAEHHRTDDKWPIYPMYDFTHGQSDSIEGVTHSLCTMEFEDHRPLYNWFLDELNIYHPQQIEFARLNLSYTMLSKRKLRQLVEENHVDGWDDPRMPTLSGLRRRGYTPKSILDFCNRIGVAKAVGMVELALLEQCLREDLNKRALRVMAVLRPLKIIIENKGDSTITNAQIIYQLNEEPVNNYTWTGTLVPGDTSSISLPSITALAYGDYELKIKAELDTNNIECDYINNQRVQRFNIRETISTLPYSEDFENMMIENSEWLINNPAGKH